MARLVAMRDQVQSWAENRDDIGDREARGESIGSSDWQWSDDTAVDIARELADVLGI